MARMTIEQAFELAIRHQTAGRLSEAESIYRQILSARPEHADSLHMLGVLAHQNGRSTEGAELVGRAIQLNAAHPGYRRSLGLVLAAAGDLAGAIEAYRAALALRPEYPEALYNLGNALGQQGQLEQAIEAYDRALALRPDDPDTLNNRGAALQRSGRLDEAIADLRAALRLRPGSAQFHNNLGSALLENGRTDEAIAALREALSVAPDFESAHYNLGNALRRMEDLDGAIDAYRRALSLRPDWIEALNNLGTALKDSGQLDGGIECYRRAAALGAGSRVFGNLLYAIHFHPNYDARDIWREHEIWNAQFARPLAPAQLHYDNDPSPDRRLRIGYVSPDFRDHSQSFFTLPLLSHHHRTSFEIFCYSDVAISDDLTARLRQCADMWRETATLSDEQLADLVRRDRIDILVDLTLHMSRNRMLTFARRPAPVQVTWLGYPGSTGLETMDYRLSDPYLDPPESTDEFYSEKTVRLPRTFWCYDPLSSGPDAGPLPALQNGSVTFGCLNGFYKVVAPTLETWARVLSAVRQSRLLILAPRGSARSRLLDSMGRHGIRSDRIEFCDRMRREDYLAAYCRVDLCLDPIPCPGHTTTLDSLWMGVPVITLAGVTAISRGGVSILSNIGLGELIAPTPDDYVRMAAEWAEDLPRLSSLRATLRQRMAASPLMDATQFAGDVEAAYRQMWRRWCP